MSVPLHVRSWYSLLEGVAGPEALVDHAAACGYTALALTDTNNLYGAMKFVERAHHQGIRPILGASLCQGESRCVVLIAEQVGYRNLCRIISRLHLGTGVRGQGSEVGPALPTTHYPLPTLLAENADGLHVLTDDLALAEPLREAFGSRLWLEVVRPAASKRREQELLEGGRRLGLKPVASTAAHFLAPAEHRVYRLMTAVRQTTLLDQLSTARLNPAARITPEHYLVDPATLRRRFRDLPEAVRNTDALAEQLCSEVLPREVVLPPARVPRRLDAVRYLHLLCERGLRRRELSDRLDARQRLRDELAVIELGRFAGYFLVVRDIARYARRQGYGMALRGSAGNSLVCFLLEITDVDPLRFGLPMERFLHPGRADLPDIDLDFDWKIRDDVIAHVFRRYGPEHTAMISSHLFLQPRSAFRETAKVHGLSNEQISRLFEVMSDEWKVTNEQSELAADRATIADSSRPITHHSSLITHHSSLPPGFPLEPERWPRILEDARLLLGRPHHLSIHPGGVAITPQPIEEYAPLQRAPKGIVITQFEKDAAEYVGLVKIDLLGNRALSTVDEAIRVNGTKSEIRNPKSETTSKTRTRNTTRDPGLSFGNSEFGFVSDFVFRISDFADREPATVALLQRGDTVGVNQLESPAMRHLLVQMKPECLDDVIQALALIRPGAASIGAKESFIRRRRGLEPARYAHPDLEPLLRRSYGLMVYEDDALRVVQAVTGLSAIDADRFRKRVTKHQTEEEAEKLAKEFLATCARRGVARAVAAELWVQLAKFNHYSFCQSHATSYGLIAWTAAYLKAHQPLVFWTAALNNNQGMYPRRVYIEAIKRAGIPLRLPCVNGSAGPFAIEKEILGGRETQAGAIRVGLEVIASLPEEVRTAILAERQRRGPYRDLTDFRRRVNPGSETLALLIRCGALDFTGRPRPALFLEAELQQKSEIRNPKSEKTKISDFGFRISDLIAEGWSPTDYAADRRLRDEWELLGFILGPPLMSLFRPQLSRDLVTSQELANHVGRIVQVAGLVATARHTPTSDGRDMQFVTLEDEWGLIEVTLFPGTCSPVAYLALGPYVVTGMVEKQYDVITVTAHRFQLCRTPS